MEGGREGGKEGREVGRVVGKEEAVRGEGESLTTDQVEVLGERQT